jgi:secreted trypsin-like serine protease
LTELTRLFCQVSVEAGRNNGDSGSPVFVQNADGTVTLHGVVWGAYTVFPSPGVFKLHYAFSHIVEIEQDLGQLTTS